jgi:hypothetical protein
MSEASHHAIFATPVTSYFSWSGKIFLVLCILVVPSSYLYRIIEYSVKVLHDFVQSVQVNVGVVPSPTLHVS